MDSSAVDQLYRAYGPAVLRRARAILRDEEQARDVMQEAFIQAMEAGGRFRGDASPMTWMYRITTNLCLNRIRDHGRRSRLLEENAKADEAAPAAAPDDRLTLAAILRGVPEHLREIAVYHYVDHMSHDEIARIIGTSRRTIGNRLEEFKRIARAAAGNGAEAAG